MGSATLMLRVVVLLTLAGTVVVCDKLGSFAGGFMTEDFPFILACIV